MAINQLGSPGVSAVQSSQEAQVWFGNEDQQLFANAVILSTTTDAVNTNYTTSLRPGLVLGRVTSTGKYTVWDSTATNGTETPVAVLCEPLVMLDSAGAVADKVGRVILGGNLKVGSLVNSDAYALKLLSRWFRLDTTPDGADWFSVPRRERIVTADTTVAAADSGTLFVQSGSSGAVAFTLPAIAKGLSFEFFNRDNQNMTITAASAVIIADGNAAVTNVAFSTASHKIGARIRVDSNAAGDKWYVTNLSANAMTLS